jgi:queuine tRNA-ribosyltransferase
MSFPSDPGRDGARPPPEEEYQHAYPDGSPHPLRFTVSRRAGRARATTVYLPHGPIETPVFMPVGTQVRRRTSGVVACFPLSVPALHRPGHLG